MKNKDIIGQVFGKLTVIKRNEKVKSTHVVYECVCECGETTNVRRQSLLNGSTRSCSCISREAASERLRKHGLSKTPEYVAWVDMIQRCTNPNKKSYVSYGARGIKICDRWQRSFENFYDDMGPRPQGMSIDRINNDGNYEPKNCRWTTLREQYRNQRKTRFFSYKGESKTISEWSKIFNITRHTLRMRLKNGWGVEKSLTTHPRKQRHIGG